MIIRRAITRPIISRNAVSPPACVKFQLESSCGVINVKRVGMARRGERVCGGNRLIRSVGCDYHTFTAKDKALSRGGTTAATTTTTTTVAVGGCIAAAAVVVVIVIAMVGTADAREEEHDHSVINDSSEEMEKTREIVEQLIAEKATKEHDLAALCQEVDEMLEILKEEKGFPGCVVAVSVDGKTVYQRGIGWADVEQRVRCDPEKTVWRIASISKPMTTAAMALLYERGWIDLDASVQDTYLKDYPRLRAKIHEKKDGKASEEGKLKKVEKEKKEEKKEKKKEEKKEEEKEKKKKEKKKEKKLMEEEQEELEDDDEEDKKRRKKEKKRLKKEKKKRKKEEKKRKKEEKKRRKKEKREKKEKIEVVSGGSDVDDTLDRAAEDEDTKLTEDTYTFSVRQLASHLSGIRHYKGKEFESNRRFNTVAETLELFKNDPYEYIPGTRYHYSTYNYNVLSAVIESILEERKHDQKTFLSFIHKNVFDELDMSHTYTGFEHILIPHRARFYKRTKRGQLVNAPAVNLTSKFAGGGFMSTASDLVKFADGMMYDKLIKPETRRLLWTPMTDADGKSTRYGLGWSIKEREVLSDGKTTSIVYHSGGAVGCSSILLMMPEKQVSVAMVCNMQDTGLFDAANDIARLFAMHYDPC